ncbi:MAG: LysM peptidoglycan-binding domain-containing protein [Patescibacteria group bacterium]|nr:LysM peptidoglycan-binding domain-containing protein [Patescibacteria group bacterium]
MLKQRSKNILTLIFLFFYFFIFLFSSTPAFAVEYGGLGGKPAYPRTDNPRSADIFIWTSPAGQTINDGVKVINNTADNKDILVYAVDSVVSSGGAFACAQKADSIKETGNWINLSKTNLTLDSMTSEIVPFTINVPQDASVGEHSACIVIQENTAPKADTKNSGMTLSFRSALRVSITIPGDLIKKIEIVSLDFIKNPDGKRFLKPKIKNTGNTSINANVRITPSLFGFLPLLKDGKSFYYGGKYLTLRGQASDWSFEVSNTDFPWGGFYKAKMTVDYNSDPNVDENIVTGDIPMTHLDGPTVSFFVMPCLTELIIEIVVSFLIILLIILIILKKKKRKWIVKHWKGYKVKHGDEIDKLANEFTVSWKLLAKINKLKPPYMLKSGTEILVPPKIKR